MTAARRDVLILGGTQWVGRALAAEALRRGHRVTCLARGMAGAVADGATLVVADRTAPDAYAAVAGRAWDVVIDVARDASFAQPAAEALAARAGHWTFISSGAAYARQDEPGADEAAALLDPAPTPYGAAKSAIEAAYRAALGGRLLIARAGLIGGPGDATCRTGYYVARAARDDAPMLVPDVGDAPLQLLDARDLAAWILSAAERGLAGAFNAVGDRTTVGAFLAASRAIAGHRGAAVAVPGAWIAAHGVADWDGPESLPVWLADPAWSACLDRSNAAAVREGLRRRPLDETLRDLLVWERAEGLDRKRAAGLSAARERELIAAWGAPSSTCGSGSRGI
ncbi:MAG: NAD-dependent epimerase/dehydratase family protein [Deltaproteobacteria bacterium]|nr:NAD-dependent epimerase/dehydratase family protein [Deltaproteobacteria bacterium]